MPTRAALPHCPQLCRHKASNQAFIRLGGKSIYFGRWGDPESSEKYHRFLAEFLANGGQRPAEPDKLTINELIARYWTHVQTYYVKSNGQPTQEQDNIRQALRPLRYLYGSALVMGFTPLALKAVRQQMIQTGWCRTNINKMIGRVKLLFRWGAENDLVTGNVYHALAAVAGLKLGRSPAPESEPVKPAPAHLIEAVEPFVSRQVWAMIQLQLLTAARSGEICNMRPCDIDRSGKIWLYQPTEHKTAWHGHHRRIYIGPRGQEVLMPFLLRPATSFCFSPAEAEVRRRRSLHAVRQTPMSCGNRPGSNRQSRPARKAGQQYDAKGYARAISRALKRAFPLPAELTPRKGEPQADYLARLTEEERAQIKAWHREHHWHPHQLRHNAATSLRREFGLDTARIILGHTSAAVTTIYAEADMQKALEVIAKVG